MRLLESDLQKFILALVVESPQQKPIQHVIVEMILVTEVAGCG